MPFDFTGARSGPFRRHAHEDWTLAEADRREALFRAADHGAEPGGDLVALLSAEAMAPATPAARAPRRPRWGSVLGMMRAGFRAA